MEKLKITCYQNGCSLGASFTVAETPFCKRHARKAQEEQDAKRQKHAAAQNALAAALGVGYSFRYDKDDVFGERKFRHGDIVFDTPAELHAFVLGVQTPCNHE